MNSKELISLLKDFIYANEMGNDADSPVIKEVNMWRQRFLHLSIDKIPIKKQDYISTYFNCIPSKNMMEKTPEEILVDLLNEL